jgi:hypothetical protein
MNSPDKLKNIYSKTRSENSLLKIENKLKSENKFIKKIGDYNSLKN